MSDQLPRIDFSVDSNKDENESLEEKFAFAKRLQSGLENLASFMANNPEEVNRTTYDTFAEKAKTMLENLSFSSENIANLESLHSKILKKNTQKEQTNINDEELAANARLAVVNWEEATSIKPGDHRYESLMTTIAHSTNLKEVTSDKYALDVVDRGDHGYDVILKLRESATEKRAGKMIEIKVVVQSNFDEYGTLVRSDKMSETYPAFNMYAISLREKNIFKKAAGLGYKILSQSAASRRIPSRAVIQAPDGTQRSIYATDDSSTGLTKLHMAMANYLEKEMRKK